MIIQIPAGPTDLKWIVGPLNPAHCAKTKGGLEPAEPYASYAPGFVPGSDDELGFEDDNEAD